VPELKRYQDLREKNFVSQAVLDGKRGLQGGAIEWKRRPPTGPGQPVRLCQPVADADGVVTRIDAEVGQVVAPGTPWWWWRSPARRSRDRHSGRQVETLRGVKDVTVRLRADPKQALPGKIREVSPVADAATRTYLAKVSIPDARRKRAWHDGRGAVRLADGHAADQGAADGPVQREIAVPCGWWKTAPSSSCP
jgi:hypothetical protein